MHVDNLASVVGLWIAVACLLGLLVVVLYNVLVEGLSHTLGLIKPTRVMSKTDIAAFQPLDANVSADVCDWIWIYFPLGEPESKEPFDILFTDLDGAPEVKCYGVKKISLLRTEQEEQLEVWACSVLRRIYYK